MNEKDPILNNISWLKWQQTGKYCYNSICYYMFFGDVYKIEIER